MNKETKTLQINTLICTCQSNINNHHLYSFCTMSSRLFSALSNVCLALIYLPPHYLLTHTHTPTSIPSYFKYLGSAIDIWPQIMTCIILNIHPSVMHDGSLVRTPTPSHIVRTNAAICDHSMT